MHQNSYNIGLESIGTFMKVEFGEFREEFGWLVDFCIIKTTCVSPHLVLTVAARFRQDIRQDFGRAGHGEPTATFFNFMTCIPFLSCCKSLLICYPCIAVVGEGHNINKCCNSEMHKGASKYEVSKIFRFFDPLPHCHCHKFCLFCSFRLLRWDLLPLPVWTSYAHAPMSSFLGHKIWRWQVGRKKASTFTKVPLHYHLSQR